MNNEMPGKNGKKFDMKKVIEWLGFVLRCPICNNKYNLENTRIIESDQNDGIGEAHMLIHSDCAKCKSSVMFNIEIKGPEVYSVGMVTDLTNHDSTKFRNKTPISANEILGLHEALGVFNGDFVRMFGTKK